MSVVSQTGCVTCGAVRRQQCARLYWPHHPTKPHAARVHRAKELMTGAARKTKMSKYEVTIKREVEYTAVVEVEARNAEEAQQTAEAAADNAGANYWREGDVTSQTAKAKIIR